MKTGMIIDDISSLKPGEDKTPPILINFVHASVRADELIDSNPVIKVDVKAEKNAKATFNLELETPNLSYVTSEDSQDPYFDTYIAIRNKATGKTRLIEALNMSLKPKVTPPQSRNPVLLEAENEAKSAGKSTLDDKELREERLNKTKELAQKFGQKSQKTFFNKMESQAVDAADTAERVKKAISDVELTDLLSAPVVSAEAGDLIPPRDEHAVRATEIYRIEHVLTEKEVIDLTAACKELLNKHSTLEAIGQAVKGKFLTPIGGHFIKLQLPRKNIIAEAEKDDMAALVVYLDTLVSFLNMRPNAISRGFRSFKPHVPHSLIQKIFETFCSGQKENRIITPQLKDKAICHVIILGLMIGAASMDLKLITESLRLDAKYLPSLVSVTGAHVVNDVASGQQKIVLRKQLASFDPNFKSKGKRGDKKRL